MLRFSIPRTARACLVLCGSAAISVAHADCKSVKGAIDETVVGGTACLSPVALCTVGQMAGQLKGTARFTASAIISSADTPTTGVVFVTGDTTVTDARLGAKRGTLLIKNAAAFRTVGDGDLTDTQVIIGAAGDLAGASGALRVTGTFSLATGTGTSFYEGTVCTP
jgi:hypothetical protein